jgi:hypothetical protein
MPAIAERVDCGVNALDAFTRNQGTLSPAVLEKLTRELLNGTYDAVSDRVMLTGGAHVNVVGPRSANIH